MDAKPTQGSATSAMPRNAISCHAQQKLRAGHPQLGEPDDEESLDFLVLYGDAGVLLAYGCVQAIFDLVERPLVQKQPGLFLPVPHAPSQAIILAAAWVGLTLALDGYSLSVTRAASRTLALGKLLAAGICASSVLIGLALSQAYSLEAELDFVLGSATALCGWRFLFASGGVI